MKTVEQLEQENEALRELVRDYMQAAAELIVHVSIGGKRVRSFEELQDRAQTLLREEQQT